MSKTEQDLEKSGADDAVDALTKADSAPTAGPNTGEIEALDSALVASIDEYASDSDDLDDSDLDGKVASAADFEEAEFELDAAEKVADADDGEEVADADSDAAEDHDGDADAEADSAEAAEDEAAEDDAAEDEAAEDDAAEDEADEIARLAALVADEDAPELDVADDEADEIARLAALVADEDAQAVDSDGDTDTDTDTSEDVVSEDVVSEDVEHSDDQDGDEVADALVEDDEPTAAVVDEPQLPADVALTDDAVQVDSKDADDPVSPVSPGILEELRRANIDGPVVDLAPQDDTTGGTRRRPKKPLDFDPAPVPVPLKVPRILGRKPRVRKVTRVVRHVDPWSVFKIALLANFVLYTIVLTAGVLLWNVAYATGTIENVERFFESFGWQSFEFNGGELYNAAWVAGLFIVIGLTGLWVLLATLFNLITDVVGGVRFTVLEEEVVEARTSPMRRFVVRRTEPEIPAVSSDASGQLIREAVVDDSGSIER